MFWITTWILSSTWLLAVVRCDVMTAADRLGDAFQQIKNQGLHISETEVCVAVYLETKLH